MNKIVDGLQVTLRNQVEGGDFVRMSDIVGLETLKKQAAGLARRIAENPNAKDLPKGIILEGVGGTGKTIFARSLAAEAKLNFLSISAVSLKAIVGSLAKNKVESLFREARRLKPCILFIDEIDAVVKDRSKNRISAEDDGLVQQLLVELDGVDKTINSGVFVICATNVIDQLDPAFKRSGRFDMVMTFNLPGILQRRTAIENYFKKQGVENYTNYDIETFSEISEGMSYSDINGFIKMAINNSKNDNKPLDNNYLLEAICSILYGQHANLDAMDVKSQSRFNYHLSGHTLAYLYMPHLFLFAKTNTKDVFCKPRHKKRNVTDVYDTFIKLFSVYLAKSADGEILNGYASGLYIQNDRDKIEQMIVNMCYLSGILIYYNNSMMIGLSHQVNLLLTVEASKMLNKYRKIFNAILGAYNSNGYLLRSDLVNIIKTSDVSLSDVQKEMQEILHKILFITIRHVDTYSKQFVKHTSISSTVSKDNKEV